MNEPLINTKGETLGHYVSQDDENGLVFEDEAGREFGVNPRSVNYVIDWNNPDKTMQRIYKLIR